MPRAMDSNPASTFDAFVESYEEACGRGLALSGESRDYFAQQRVRYSARLCAGMKPRRILDFGCGLGHTTPYLAEAFPGARVIGIDTSAGAIDAARKRYGSARIEFISAGETLDPGSIDLVYTNGTFHHIEPADRPPVVNSIARWLAPDGAFVFWENNPWNPGARMVMRRIPFDRDAKMLSYREATALLAGSGLGIERVRSYFYFPSWLKALRPLERALEPLPLGAQYCVLARASRADRPR